MKSLIALAVTAIALASTVALNADPVRPAGTAPAAAQCASLATHPAAPEPSAFITLGHRQGHVKPAREGFTHTGGGNIHVAQPAPDTVIVTMTGAAMAGAHPLKNSFASLKFDLVQSFEIGLTGPTPGQAAKVSLDARVVGLLRSYGSGCCRRSFGSAETSAASAAVAADDKELIAIAVEPHEVGGGEDLSVNDHQGPVETILPPGRYTLHQSFALSAAHVGTLLPCGHASSEFAPEQALDPLWIGNRESFHGAIKKELGFQVTLHVALQPSADASTKQLDTCAAQAPVADREHGSIGISEMDLNRR
jgi:hypothetical protein